MPSNALARLTRPVRADARRNDAAQAAAADAVVAEQGGQAALDAIAQRAGVGIGALYRHSRPGAP